MSAHILCTVTLCVALLTHICLSATAPPDENSLSKEDNLKGEIEESLILDGHKIESQDENIKSELKSSESEEDSDSEDKYGVTKSYYNFFSSESMENRNSQEEENGNKTKHKRSLDSDQDLLNKITDGEITPKENSTDSDKGESNHEPDSVTNDDSGTTIIDNADDTSTTTSKDLPEESSEQTTVDSETTTIETTSTTIVNTPESVSETNENKEESTGGETSQTTQSSVSQSSGEVEDFTQMALARADKLSEQIRKILMHYRKEGVVVVPGQSFFPEPMYMQDFKKSFSIGTVDFMNTTVHGLPNFTVEHINTDVDKMQVYILLHMKQLTVLGNYTLKTFWSRTSGPFNVTLLNVSCEGVAEIETTQEGHLEASDSDMDMSTENMLLDFKKMSTVLQSILNSVGDALFDSMKPQILDRVNLVIRKDVNDKLKEFSVKFVNRVAPVDLAFSEGRRYVRDHGYDPLHIEQHGFVVGGVVNINISEFTVKGLSKFNRVGNLSLSMDAGIIQFGVHVLTNKLTGGFKWSGDAFGISRQGQTNYTIENLQVRALVNQSLDVRQKPQLEQLDLHLGWLRVTMKSPMALNMMVEGIINAFPKIIKHMIVDALEVPLKVKIQEILNEVNVESFVDSNLPRLDSFGL